jgi:hypothetical protein
MVPDGRVKSADPCAPRGVDDATVVVAWANVMVKAARRPSVLDVASSTTSSGESAAGSVSEVAVVAEEVAGGGTDVAGDAEAGAEPATAANSTVRPTTGPVARRWSGAGR